MILSLLAILFGFALLVWSADKFVEGSSITAKHLGMSSLLIGMIVVGFGTSAPEMVVSVMAALDEKPELALGNALGSNIVNTGLILGVTALVAPIAVQSNIIRRELPILLAIGVLIGALFWNGALARSESIILLSGFFILIGWSIYSARKNQGDSFEAEIDQELISRQTSLKQAIFWLVIGLVLLLISSRILVWGAVNIAEALGVSDLIIGLTIVALGTSLPELAASIIAARKGEHDIAIGNIIGSNMFNLLAVVGIAGMISPLPIIPADIMTRDWPVLMGMTLVLFMVAYGFRKEGRINRFEGGLLVTFYIAYLIYLIISVI